MLFLLFSLDQQLATQKLGLEMAHPELWHQDLVDQLSGKGM